MTAHSNKKRLPALLVEPSSYFADLIKEWLTEIGLDDVRVCTTLRAARALLNEQRFSVIVCELKLQEMTGLHLAHEARRGVSPLNRLTPIIALTGGATSGRVETARDLGISEFICKPLSRKAFVDRVGAALFNPRNFIKAGDFFGPDRRRRSGEFGGSDRRRQKPRRVLVSDVFPGADA